ncbi:MAG: glycosyltransferase [Chitinophagaceae bacterium]
MDSLSENPLVSIVVSTYNGEKYIDEQLVSLVEQDYPHLEIIICDDASKDNTWNILTEWQQRYPSKIHIHPAAENVGWSLNFGKAVALAKGQYIAWCDQDDRWMADKVSSIVKVFGQHPDATLVYHDAYEFKGENEVVPKPPQRFSWAMFEGDDPVTLFWHCRILGHRMVFPARIKQYILPATDLSYDWWIQVLAASIGKVYYIDKKFVAQRIHADNATGANDPNMGANYMRRRLQHLKSFHAFRGYMKDGDGKILDKMTTLMEKHVHGKFDWPLFFFGVKYRYRLYNFLQGGNVFTREIFRWRTARSWAKNW